MRRERIAEGPFLPVFCCVPDTSRVSVGQFNLKMCFFSVMSVKKSCPREAGECVNLFISGTDGGMLLCYNDA